MVLIIALNGPYPKMTHTSEPDSKQNFHLKENIFIFLQHINSGRRNDNFLRLI